MKKVVWAVMDYGPDDLAMYEVIDRLHEEVPSDWHVERASVPNFDTAAAALVSYQLALKSHHAESKRLIYINVAPRRDRSEGRNENEGEEFHYAKLDNGVEIVFVNSGYTGSLFRPHIVELYRTTAKKGGSQFRSRDIFPITVGKVAAGDHAAVFQDKLDPHSEIPEIPNNQVLYRDNFGNMKLSLRKECDLFQELSAGERVSISIEGTERTAFAVQGSFNVAEGDLALSVGSSGHQNRFVEIFQRGGSAWKAFGRPNIGATVEMKTLSAA